MSRALRLLLIGSKPVWLPPFRAGRLLVGSAATADVRLPSRGLLPFHCLVELDATGAAVVHDLARRGDVLDGKGGPLPAQGLRVAAGEQFRVAGEMLALVDDAGLVSDVHASLAAEVCAVCGEPVRGKRGRAVADAAVCEGCLGVTGIDPLAFPGYELVAALGQGAMGYVYLARQIANERLVALKAIRTEGGTSSSNLISRFERETGLLASLDHPNIVRVLDAGSVAAGRFIVCELVRGGDAAARLARTGPFPPAEAARVGIELASALAFLHANGVVHRDVKPANVLLERDLTAKLSDFGLSKDLVAPAYGASTASGATLGTIAYAAPEQLKDARRAGPPADVFGLGATSFHLATGRAPRERVTISAMKKGALETLPQASSISKAVPRSLSDALATALRPAAADRPTASELGASLMRVLVGLRAEATS